MNYEVNAYVEAQKTLPSREVVLETKKGKYFHFKTDNFGRMITYSLSPIFPKELVTIDAKRAFDVIKLNERGEIPDTLDFNDERKRPQEKPKDILSDNSLTRFDKKMGNRGNGKRFRNNGPRPEAEQQKRPNRNRRDNRSENKNAQD